MAGYKKVLTDRFKTILVIVVLLATALPNLAVPSVYAVTNVKDRYDKVANSQAGALTTHLIGFRYTDFATPIGSVRLEFCANDPVPNTTCTVPSGFDASAANVVTQSGEVGYSIHASSTQNVIILSRPAATPTFGASKYEFSNVSNPNILGTYYIRIQTYTATDASGLAVEEGGIAINISDALTVSAEVPPHLTFCTGVTITGMDCSSANSFYIDFGEFSKTATKSASSQMVAATNAEFGYSIFASGTTFASGNNTIPAPVTPTSATPGTSQFGINLRANANPVIGEEPIGPGTASVAPNYGVANKFMYAPGDSVVTAVHSQDYRKFTVSYIVNIANAQPAGVYATTLTYICLANF